MTSEEKRAWVLGPVSVVACVSYLAAVLGGGVPYVAAMLWSVGGAVVVSIVLHIALTVRSPREPKDERDREIARFGDHVGGSTITAGGVVALALALFEVRSSWIANVLYLGFVLSAVLGSTARIVAYRYGLPRRHAW
nr:hypothetical protein [uncultured Actinoplanes sp.]